jgi:tripartite-type tricarboxylate transporter receptor subunit TctC
LTDASGKTAAASAQGPFRLTQVDAGASMIAPRLFTVLVATAWCAASLSWAQPFSSRPLQLVVPNATGAAPDTLARIIAEAAKEEFGNIVVDNRPGGSGTIAAALVKRAAPDGHTLLLAGNTYVVAEAMNIPRQHDFLKDFEPVIRLSDLPFYLVVRQDSVPTGSLREFVEFVKARPGKLDYITPGNGSTHHLAMEMFKLQSRLDIVHVPYKTIAQGVTDMLAGRVHMTITGYPAVASHMKTGTLRILATVGARRSALQPDIPTFAEAGVPGVELVSWWGVVAPAGIPKPVLARLNAAFNRVLEQPQVREKLAGQGLDPVGGSAEALASRIREDYERLVRVIRDTGIKPD